VAQLLQTLLSALAGPPKVAWSKIARKMRSLLLYAFVDLFSVGASIVREDVSTSCRVMYLFPNISCKIVAYLAVVV
jgi:hypothetical protein